MIGYNRLKGTTTGVRSRDNGKLISAHYGGGAALEQLPSDVSDGSLGETRMRISTVEKSVLNQLGKVERVVH